MKRSEIVRIIHNYLLENKLLDMRVLLAKELTYHDVANLLVEKIEENGMTPPEYNQNEGSGKFGIPSLR